MFMGGKTKINLPEIFLKHNGFLTSIIASLALVAMPFSVVAAPFSGVFEGARGFLPERVFPAGSYAPGQVVVELEGPEVGITEAEDRIFSQVALGFRPLELDVVSESHIRKHRGRRVVVEFDESVTTVEEVVAEIEARPGVLSASPNVYFYATQQTSNDPSFNLKDDLYNTGTNAGRSGGVFDADIDAELAWQTTNGDGAVIAVIDSGVDTDHPDLDDNLWVNSDELLTGTDSDGNGYIDDINGYDFVAFDYPGTGGTTPRTGGDPNLTADPDPNPEPNNDNEDGEGGADSGAEHGTHVAGIAAAEGGNAEGVIGAAPGAKIMALRALDDEGQGILSQIQDAVDYAIDNGADVINMSLSTDGGPSGSAYTSSFNQSIEDAWSTGVSVVAAAGNTAKDLAAFPESPVSNDCGTSCLTGSNKVIGVAALSNDDSRAGYSNFSTSSTHVDVAAPGGGTSSGSFIYSTEFDSPGHSCCTGFYGYKIGTSMAAPQVAGMAALLRADNPSMSVHTIRERIRNNADEIAAANVGAGRSNAVHALFGDDIMRFNGFSSPTATRYDTAVSTSHASFPEDGSADAVVLASGVNFPDGLAGTALAGSENAPLLLTDGATLTAATLAEIQRVLDDTTKPVYILGGVGVITSAIETALSGVSYNNTVRLDGGGGAADRIDTAIDIADVVAPGSVNEVVMVNSQNFPDAISASSVVAERGIPLLLNQQSWLDNRNRDWMVAHSVDRVYLVGGTGVLASWIEGLIEAQGIAVTRLAGASDRYDTSAEIAKCFYSTTSDSPCNGVTSGRSNPTHISSAVGTGFPDALTGGPYAAKSAAPLLLVEKTKVPGVILSYVSLHAASVYEGFIFGGSAVVNDTARSTLDTYINL